MSITGEPLPIRRREAEGVTCTLNSTHLGNRQSCFLGFTLCQGRREPAKLGTGAFGGDGPGAPNREGKGGWEEGVEAPPEKRTGPFIGP